MQNNTNGARQGRGNSLEPISRDKGAIIRGLVFRKLGEPIYFVGLLLLSGAACTGAAKDTQTDWERSVSSIEPFLETLVVRRQPRVNEPNERLLYIVTYGVISPGTPVLGPAQRRGEIRSPHDAFTVPYVLVAEPPWFNNTNIATIVEVVIPSPDKPYCNIHLAAWSRQTNQWGVVFSSIHAAQSQPTER